MENEKKVTKNAPILNELVEILYVEIVLKL